MFNITAGFLDLIGFDNITGSAAINDDPKLKDRLIEGYTKRAIKGVKTLERDIPQLVEKGFPITLADGNIAFVKGDQATIAIYDIIQDSNTYVITGNEMKYYREMSRKLGFSPSSDRRYLKIWSKLVAREIKTSIINIYAAMPLTKFRKSQDIQTVDLFNPDKTPTHLLAEKLLAHFGITNASRVVGYASMIRTNYSAIKKKGLRFDQSRGELVNTQTLPKDAPQSITPTNVFSEEVYEFTVGDRSQKLWGSLLEANLFRFLMPAFVPR
jgi:hypothetical protein